MFIVHWMTAFHCSSILIFFCRWCCSHQNHERKYTTSFTWLACMLPSYHRNYSLSFPTRTLHHHSTTDNISNIKTRHTAKLFKDDLFELLQCCDVADRNQNTFWLFVASSPGPLDLPAFLLFACNIKSREIEKGPGDAASFLLALWIDNHTNAGALALVWRCILGGQPT